VPSELQKNHSHLSQRPSQFRNPSSLTMSPDGRLDVGLEDVLTGLRKEVSIDTSHNFLDSLQRLSSGPRYQLGYLASKSTQLMQNISRNNDLIAARANRENSKIDDFFREERSPLRKIKVYERNADSENLLAKIGQYPYISVTQPYDSGSRMPYPMNKVPLF